MICFYRLIFIYEWVTTATKDKAGDGDGNVISLCIYFQT